MKNVEFSAEFGVAGGVQAEAFHSCLKEPRIRSLVTYSS